MESSHNSFQFWLAMICQGAALQDWTANRDFAAMRHSGVARRVRQHVMSTEGLPVDECVRIWDSLELERALRSFDGPAH